MPDEAKEVSDTCAYTIKKKKKIKKGANETTTQTRCFDSY